MTERRYSDEEISAIFSKAVQNPQLPPLQAPREDGLTLAELQQIGREVGITPDAVAHAAQLLDVRPLAASRRFLGLPISVERTITLDRRLTDAEWEHLVVQLREVFEARGAVSAQGTFRQWTNGNLQALLEPTATGQRLRLSTTKGSARTRIAAGMAALGMGAVVAISSAIAGHIVAATPGIATMMLTGAGMIAYSVFPLPRWARLRARQMDAIVAGLAISESESPSTARGIPGGASSSA